LRGHNTEREILSPASQGKDLFIYGTAAAAAVAMVVPAETTEQNRTCYVKLYL